MDHHPLANVVRADDSRTIADLFGHPKVVEGLLLSSPSQTWVLCTRSTTRVATGPTGGSLLFCCATISERSCGSGA